MIVKAVTLFLIAMLVLGMFGKLRLPRPRGGPRRIAQKPRKCPDCGGYVLDGGTCPCRKRT